MSDIEMELSPGSETGSDHSEAENPPTPGSCDGQDGEEKISHDASENEKSDQEESSEITKSDQGVHQEHDLSDKEEIEEKDSVVSPISSVSPVAPISPISPTNEASDDEGGNEMEVDDELGNTEQKSDDKQDSKVEKEDIVEEENDVEREDDIELENNVEKEENVEKEDGKEHLSANSPGEDLTQSDNENVNEVNKKEIMEVTKDVESPEGDYTKSEETEETSSEVQAKDVLSVKNDSLEENDLLNITEISEISVDLTGDEEAIVDDILQNVGDGELLPDEGDKEKQNKEKTSEKTSKDDDDNEEQPGELMNDIFGSSDEDDEDFEGFKDDELHGTTKVKKKSKAKVEKKGAIISDDEGEVEKDEEQKDKKTTEEESLTVPPPQDSDDEDDDVERRSEIFISDFDLMMQKKKEENRKTHRRRKGVDIINDSDDLVVDIIKRMQEAANEDRLANEARQAATKKLKLLPTVLKHMLKIDLMVVFVDSNVLPVLKDWISPLPDGSLPHIQIREGILKILEQLPPVDSGALKVSGIGKAVMYLFRHPKESRKNKERAGKLISEWSRPIFGVTANFKSMSREEREERDYANMSKRRRLSSDGVDGGKTPKRIENAIKADSKALRPGEKGWCMRARVPAPSNKDYVVRPKSTIEYVDFSKTSKKTLNRFEKQKRKLNEKKAGTKKQRAVEISLEGRKMAL